MIIGVWFLLCLILTIVLVTIFINSWQNEDTELTFGDMLYVLMFMMFLYFAGCYLMLKNGILVI